MPAEEKGSLLSVGGLLLRPSSAPQLGDSDGDDVEHDAMEEEIGEPVIHRPSWPVHRLSKIRDAAAAYRHRRRGSSSAVGSPVALKLTGIDGATSLKEELAGRVPVVNDAATFREVRRLVREEFHGAIALLHELIISGYVDPETLKLNTGDQIFNIFARLGAGVMEQPDAQSEQEALGELAKRFLICRNEAESDARWDSADATRLRTASMSGRHRFLTTRDLDWEWFNALTFGLLPTEDGGVGLPVAIREVEAMKTACLRYATSIGGWSDQIGLFVNVFGHNPLNSFFIHILDMSCLGPNYDVFNYRNMPLDEVLTVLREEAITQMPPPAPLREKGLKLGASSRSTAANVCVDGKAGATSLKSETAARFPDMRNAGEFRQIRKVLRAELGGASAIFGELARAGFVDRQTRRLTTGTQPFNVFARIAAGELVQPGMQAEQAALGAFQSSFVVCCNRAENDENWHSEDKEWLGKASMSLRHRFLTTKDLHWQWFNALVFGLAPAEEGGADYPTVLTELELMKAAALHYTKHVGGWSENVGLYVHVYGHCSVNSLHVHILDLEVIGPTFRALFHKNLSLDDVYKVVKEEYLASLSIQELHEHREPTSEKRHDGGKTCSLQTSQVGASRPISGAAVHAHFEGPLDILDLNVGGTHLSVARSTFFHAPKGSVLHSLLADGSQDGFLEKDAAGRIFLDLPPEPFVRIVDCLRAIRLTSIDDSVDLFPKDAADESCEFWTLAHFLGVAELFAGKGDC